LRLKTDENLGQQAAVLLRNAGHDVATVPEQELCRTPDRALIEICRQEARCLVTMDLDFNNPLLFNPVDYPGVAVLRLPARPTPQDLLDVLHTLVGALSQRQITGRLWIVQRGRIREYQPKD
jgi:predicted nuclease of predicted toxin-antitoxin system